jgi:hypothetical protein
MEQQQRRRQEAATDHRAIRRGWCLGSEAFRQELLAAAVERARPGHYGPRESLLFVFQRQWRGAAAAER